MGEAKRRKLLDANYGQGHDISSPRSLARHIRILFRETDPVWFKELRVYLDPERADKMLADWMQQRMSSFKAQDRPTVATALAAQYVESGTRFMKAKQQASETEDYETAWGRMFQAIVKSLEPWLPDDIKQDLDLFLEPLLYGPYDLNERAKMISAVEPQSLLRLEGSDKVF